MRARDFWLVTPDDEPAKKHGITCIVTPSFFFLVTLRSIGEPSVPSFQASGVKQPPPQSSTTHTVAPFQGDRQNSEHPRRGTITITNPLVSYHQRHHRKANMLKRARPEDDGEIEHTLSSSCGMLNGSVPVTGRLGVRSPSAKKRRSKLQLRTHPSFPSTKLTVTPPAATTAIEASYVFSPPVEAQSPFYYGGSNNDDNSQDMDMTDELHAPYSVIIGPPTPVSDGGEGEGDVEMKEASDTGREGEKDKERERQKPKLRMGYLADCEKCRLRIPGHYIHY